MRLRPLLLALAVSLAAAGTSAAAQTAAPAAPHPATARQPAVRPAPTVTARPAAIAKPAATPTPATAATLAAKAEPIDINTATSADLRTIPGIGDVYARKIIAGRPYHAKDDLAHRKVLPAAVYAKVKDRIIARQH